MTIDSIGRHAGLVTRTIADEEPGPLPHRIELTRDYDHPIDDLWSAWTEPERMARWLGEPHGELAVGGTCRLVMSPPDGDVARLRIVSCTAPRELVSTWQPSWDATEPESLVELHLHPLDDARTRLTLVHRRLRPDDAVGYGAGWEEFLALLDAVLSGRSSGDPGYDRRELERAATPRWRAVLDAR